MSDLLQNHMEKQCEGEERKSDWPRDLNCCNWKWVHGVILVQAAIIRYH